MKFDFENLNENIYTGDTQDWVNMLSDFSELTEEIIFMFRNPVMFSENDRYDLLENFRKVCKCFANDNRATGTLMKDLDING